VNNELKTVWRKVAVMYLKMFYEELHNLYSSPDIIRMIKSRRIRWEGHVARMREMRNAYSFFIGEPKGKRPLGRPTPRWEDNIKMDRMEMCGLDSSGS
jgi:hypothetical protein